MEPTDFAGANFTFTAPPRMDNCVDLRVARFNTPLGSGFLSKWKPSLEEIAALNNGQHLNLIVYGDSHPPVALFVTTKPDHQGDPS